MDREIAAKEIMKLCLIVCQTSHLMLKLFFFFYGCLTNIYNFISENITIKATGVQRLHPKPPLYLKPSIAGTAKMIVSNSSAGSSVKKRGYIG